MAVTTSPTYPLTYSLAHSPTYLTHLIYLTHLTRLTYLTHLTYLSTRDDKHGKLCNSVSKTYLTGLLQKLTPLS